MCYWTIQSYDKKNNIKIPFNNFLEIKINSLSSGVNFYVSNGTSANVAAGETTMGTYSSNILTYSANTTLFVIAVATDVSPMVNFSYRYYQVPIVLPPPPPPPPIFIPTCVAGQQLYVWNGTYYCDLIPTPPAPPIVIVSPPPPPLILPPAPQQVIIVNVT